MRAARPRISVARKRSRTKGWPGGNQGNERQGGDEECADREDGGDEVKFHAEEPPA
jgi:hypothetical protein